MAQSSESLLQMISNLKISAVANDTAAMNHRIDQRTEELKGAEDGTRENISLVIHEQPSPVFPDVSSSLMKSLPIFSLRANAGAGHLGTRGIKASTGIRSALLFMSPMRSSKSEI